MLYEKINGELQPTTIQPKQVRKLTGTELVDIHRKLTELIQQKGFNRNGKPFSADDLVGKNQIVGKKTKPCKQSFGNIPNLKKGKVPY